MSAGGLEEAATRWRAARTEERRLMAKLYEEMQSAHATGMSEVAIAKAAGVDRMTVRRALGKL